MDPGEGYDACLQRQGPPTQPAHGVVATAEKGEAEKTDVGGRVPVHHSPLAETPVSSQQVVAPAIRARPQQAVDEALVGKGEGDGGKQLCVTERVGRNEGKTVLLLPVQHPCIHEGLGRNADHVVVVNGHQMKAERSDDHAHR